MGCQCIEGYVRVHWASLAQRQKKHMCLITEEKAYSQPGYMSSKQHLQLNAVFTEHLSFSRDQFFSVDAKGVEQEQWLNGIRAPLPGKGGWEDRCWRLVKYNFHRVEERLDLFPVSSSERNQIKLEDAGFRMGKDPSGEWHLSCRTTCTLVFWIYGIHMGFKATGCIPK